MDVEHEVKSFPIDENLDAEVKKLAAEGWEIMPGVKPLAIYHLVRVKKAASGMGKGTMVIDESKVFVIPASERKQ